MEKFKYAGHAAVLSANVIFGLGVPVSKLLLDSWVTPMGYIATRSFFAAVIFWLIAFFIPKEHVERKDLFIILLGGVMGFVVSQTLTAWALTYTSPVYFSLVAALTPVGVMIMAALFIGEKISGLKVVGVALGIIGGLLMLIKVQSFGSGLNDLFGITLAVLSVLTWAIYLIITRKVSHKYTPVTQMKWVFLISAVITVPWAYFEPGQSALFSSAVEWQGVAEMAFIVLFATVLGYFFIPFAMKYIGATTVSVYTNIQPVVASVVAIIIGQDVLTWDKPVAGALVLLSAYIVTMAASKSSATTN